MVIVCHKNHRNLAAPCVLCHLLLASNLKNLIEVSSGRDAMWAAHAGQAWGRLGGSPLYC